MKCNAKLITSDQHSLTGGDIQAVRYAHSHLHALLAFICSDNLEPFQRLPGHTQQDLLRLAYSTSETILEILG